MAAKTPSPSYKLQSQSAVTFVNNSHATKQRTKNNKTVANPMSTSATGTSTMGGTFVDKSDDPDESKNSDDDDDDEGTLIIRGDSVESMGYTETAIVKTTVEKDTQKRPVSSKISEIAKSYEKMNNNAANSTSKSSMSGTTSNGTFVVNGTDTADVSPRLSANTPRQSVKSPFGSKRLEGRSRV